MKYVIGAIAVFLAFIIAMMIREMNVATRCLALGYSNSSMPGFTGYCSKRVDQTDVVVRLDTMRGRN